MFEHIKQKALENYSQKTIAIQVRGGHFVLKKQNRLNLNLESV